MLSDSGNRHDIPPMTTSPLYGSLTWTSVEAFGGDFEADSDILLSCCNKIRDTVENILAASRKRVDFRI